MSTTIWHLAAEWIGRVDHRGRSEPMFGGLSIDG